MSLSRCSSSWSTTLSHRDPGDADGGALGGRTYAVGDSDWDREAFTLIYQLFQMTVTDVSRVGVPGITISK